MKTVAYKKPKDKTFEYTNEQMVKDCIAIIGLTEQDTVLDAGSGANKVWFNNVPCSIKYECELEEGNDFFQWTKPVDWIIGNPPFHCGWLFMEQASKVATKGIGFLVNGAGLNSNLNPRRLDIVRNNCFELQHVHIVADKRWYGRYFFLIFEKKSGMLSWEKKIYGLKKI